MGMPVDLVLVRHGQSVGNQAASAARAGDESHYTEDFMTTPGHLWKLTDLGREQAAVTGAWLEELGGFTRHYTSPYVRTRQTAAALGLEAGTEPVWRLNRDLRERDWGDIGSIPMRAFRARPEYTLNVVARDTDPLYWCPPNGESLARVAENRVRNFFDTLHRNPDPGRVLAVTHGETMMAFRLLLERLSDAEFARILTDRAQRPQNAEVFHYTRIRPPDDLLDPGAAAALDVRARAVPVGGDAGHLAWMRRAAPRREHGRWQMRVQAWRPVPLELLTNTALLDCD